MKLSILIPTISSREAMLCRLLDRLLPQRVDGVEVIVRSDNGEDSIGAKRNALVAQSKGEWICFIDDDDLVAPDYVARILAALTLNPDCVGFWVNRYVNGAFEARACHSLRYCRYATNENGQERIYERTPNHLNPIRREIAESVPFPELNHGEDTSYAVRAYPLLESEVFIDAPLYDYLYIPLPGRMDEQTNEALRHTSPDAWFKAQVA
jgi:glycosyltransferase involved in cell wall biosynthesis